MKKTKIAIIVATSPSVWQSCRIITPNIDKCYRNLIAKSGGSWESQYYNFHDNQSELELLSEAKRAAQWQPDIVVFMDHQPHPIGFLKNFQAHAKNKPRFVFHVYGDFTLFTNDWVKIGSMIEGHECQFIAASHRQVELIGSFMQNPKSVHYCPFPVDTDRFYFDDKLRKEARKSLSIKDDEHVFLYTGRLSPQKNTADLIRGFQLAFAESKKPPIFIFAGTFDNLGTPYIGSYLASNEYYAHILLRLNKLESKLKERVHYIGNLDPEYLVSYYLASDTFVSLSLHNDEDYGMSPIESLLCGTKSILTDWAGYTSFATQAGHTELIPVNFDNHRLSYDMDLFVASLKAAQANGIHNSELRQEIHNHYSSRFSIAAGSKRIEEIILKGDHQFTGYTDKIRTMAALFKSNPYSPFGHSRRPLSYNAFYEDIYAPYFRKLGPSA